MDSYFLSLSAAFACAICNGTAAVLQKISADKEKNVQSLEPGLLWRLFQDKPYLIGIGLDILGWLFTLYAVHNLPLFLVEAVIAVNIAITAFIERLFRHKIIKFRAYLAIMIILLGLILLAIAGSPERAHRIGDTLRLLIILGPLPVAAAGYILAKMKGYRSSIGLAILGGLAFGGTSVVGRILTFSHPVWHVLYNPLVFPLIANGVLGILLFSTALQRAQATVINATMTASQTLIPTVIGIIFLGDVARHGLGYLIIIGTVLTTSGVVGLAFGYQKIK